ncbi:MAG: hypothetical protein MUC97_11755 [Bernardetiaceae bacterium]|nr:hypothetical protein [Bernardetiaceae bacterium]
MAVTRLKRKEQRNSTKTSDRKSRIKFLLSKPTIKNIDVEAIKASFEEKKKSA